MKGLGIINWLRWDSDSDLSATEKQIEVMENFTELLNQNKWEYSKHPLTVLQSNIHPMRYLLEVAGGQDDEPKGIREGVWLERPLPMWENPDDENIVSPFTDPNSPFYLDREVVARDGVDPLSSIIILGAIDEDIFPDAWGDEVLPDELVNYFAPVTFTYWESEMWWIVDDPNFANEFVAYLEKHGKEVLTDENWNAFKAWKMGA